MANNGTVVRSGMKKYALALSSRSDELWLLDENGGAKLVHGSGGIVSLRAEQNSAT